MGTTNVKIGIKSGPSVRSRFVFAVAKAVSPFLQNSNINILFQKERFVNRFLQNMTKKA
jgi:hypothetical protein